MGLTIIARALVGLSLMTGCDGNPPLDAPVMPARLALPTVDTSLPASEPSVDLDGSGSTYVGGLKIAQSTGSVEIVGRVLPAIAVGRSEFHAQRIVLHELYALQSDGFFLLWVYCKGGAFDLIYIEDSRGLYTRFDNAKGTCAEPPRASSQAVHFPSADIAWPQVLTGFDVAGPSIRLKPGSPGAVRYGGAVYATVTFALVDCSACDITPWHELHALLWSPENRAAIVGLFYLLPQDPGHVRFEYVLDLGTLKALPSETYSANWTFTGFVASL